MKNRNIFLSALLILALAFSMASFAFAGSSELKQDLNEVEDAQDETSKKLSQVENDIKFLQSKVDNLISQITDTTKDIKDTEEKIVKKQEEMDTQENNLNERLKVMYKNGSVGFLDVLLGSNSISEFASNMDIIQKIYENDVNVLETLKDEHAQLEQVKVELKAKKKKLAEQQTQLTSEKEELDSKKKELEDKEDELKAEADRLTQEIKKLMNADKKYEGGTFKWPCPSSHYITSSFGNRLHPILKVWKYHTGVDIGASSGKNILAAASGTVIMATNYGGYGKCVMIDHGSGLVTLYGHASKLLVSKGDTVSKGDVIALVGSTGNSTGPHLHFEVRVNGDYVDPMSYF